MFDFRAVWVFTRPSDIAVYFRTRTLSLSTTISTSRNVNVLPCGVKMQTMSACTSSLRRDDDLVESRHLGDRGLVARVLAVPVRVLAVGQDLRLRGLRLFGAGVDRVGEDRVVLGEERAHLRERLDHGRMVADPGRVEDVDEVLAAELLH